ncbi:MAG: DUF2597 family protein, partial [Collinsella intestinalis]|nr:DUF2597 family protein [Collinsella intestinalis]
LGDLKLHIEKASLDIEDGSEVAKTGGVPNGWVDGEVSASGEIELDGENVKILSEAARNAGSFRGLPEFDLLFYGSTGDGAEMKVESFGCKLKVSKLLDVDGKGGEKHITTIPYIVTSPDFVRINGTPYLKPEETEEL